MVLDILLSRSVVYGLLFLVAVVAASYTGTKIALMRYFEQEGHEPFVEDDR